jgi:glycerophosphoryl diester phosphodiesterase
MAAIAMGAPKKILVEGHRGARSVLPENTLPGFEYAIKAGADYIELDLAVTKDGVPVVSHDQHINRNICQGPDGETAIHRMTLAEVRAFDCGALKNPEFPKQTPVPGTKLPTLDEVLKLAARGSFKFNIETKSDPKKPELAPAPAGFAKLVAAAVRKHKLEKRVVVQSFDWRVLIEMKKIAPELRLAALWGGAPKDFLEIAAAAGGVPVVSPNWALVTKAEVEKAHAAGLEVVPWTPNTPEGWDKMIEAGVDAIITDDPAALIAHLKAKGLR